MTRLFGGLAALALLLVARPASAGYLVTDLGNLGGATPNAINSAGQVVGGVYAGNGTDAFLYSGGVLHDLSAVLGQGSTAFGINAGGQIVGSYSTPFAQHGFLYGNGVVTDLGVGSAYGINDVGTVVGGSLGGAYLYSGGKLQKLGTLPGDIGSVATAINASGQVVGSSWSSTGSRLFLYSQGSMKNLGSLGGDYLIPSGINASGQIVGGATLAGGNQTHAFLYSGGAWKDLGLGYAYGINDAGQVVGGSGGSAFLYNGGTLTNLNNLLPPGSGNLLSAALAINDKGQIVAAGRDGHGYLLTPDGVAATPEPGSLTLLALGGAGLLGGAWRAGRRRTRCAGAPGGGPAGGARPRGWLSLRRATI